MLKKMIKPLLASAFVLLPLSTVCSAATKTADFDYKLEPKQVSKNVWCFFGALEAPTKENAGNMNNSCYIKTKDSWVLWDTGTSYVFAKQAYAAMTKVAGKKLPVKTILMSHEHDDHWLGNNYYKEVHKTQIIGPESFNSHYKTGDKTRMFGILPENAIRGTKIVKVDKSNKNGMKFAISGVNFEYVPVGKSHSVEDYIMYMPDNKLILAGDVVMNGRITSNRDGSVMGQLKALETINSKDWTTLIPGHGFIIDKTAMDESKLYFTLTKDRIQGAMKNGIDSTGIVEAVPLEEFKDKKMYDMLNAMNVSDAYNEFEALEDSK
jgi:cyclase